MNFFYGINNDIFKSQIQIPLFQNSILKPAKLNLYKCYPNNNLWKVEEVKNKKINNHFYILKNEDIDNNVIFFLANQNTLEGFNNKKLKKFNNFTDTNPAFRANLQIYLEKGGFSSYQSEYPFSMILKKGNILTPIYSLTNVDSDQNYILFRNIVEDPISENFNAYLVNYKTKKIEDKFDLKTNYTNCFKIDKKLIRPEMFFVTKNFIGVPMFASVKDSFVSFEHSQPPFEYILSKNNHIKVSDLKKEFNEIIN